MYIDANLSLSFPMRDFSRIWTVTKRGNNDTISVIMNIATKNCSVANVVLQTGRAVLSGQTQNCTIAFNSTKQENKLFIGGNYTYIVQAFDYQEAKGFI